MARDAVQALQAFETPGAWDGAEPAGGDQTRTLDAVPEEAGPESRKPS
jgi:hypothetical protein